MSGLPLKSRSGDIIHKFSFNQSHILDRNIILLGPSSTGKTIITKRLANAIREKIGLTVLVSPTEEDTPSFKGLIDPFFIKYHCTIGLINQFNTMQKKVSQIYSTTQSKEKIEALYKQCRDPELDMRIKSAHELVERKFPDSFKTKIEENEKNERDYKRLVIKKNIHLFKNNASEDRQKTLDNLDLNPHGLLILDDCAGELLGKMKSKDKGTEEGPFTLIGMRGRHIHITSIITLQDSNFMPPFFRDNAFIVIFTSKDMAMRYYESSKAHTKEEKLKIFDIVTAVFANKSYRLAYIRKFKKFFYIDLSDQVDLKKIGISFAEFSKMKEVYNL